MEGAGFPPPTEFMSQMWQLTANNISDILVLLEPYEPYRILWINEAHRNFLEHPEDSITGQPLASLLIPPEVQRITGIIRQVADSGEPLYIDELEVKGLQFGKKYGLPENTVYWAVKVLPIKDSEGRIAAVYGIGTDITATRVSRYATELARERSRLAAILEAVPSGVMVTEGKELTVTLLNRRALDLFGRAVQPGKPLPQAWQLKLCDLYGTMLSPEQLPVSLAVQHGELVHDVQVVLERPDGKRIVVHANAAPLYDEQGRTYGAVGTFEDITALTETQQYLQAAQEQLRQDYVKEHYISETLQQALLPPIPEWIETVNVSCEYHPAYEEAHVGGDFYDIFTPAPGLVGMVIGDVSGKGVNAAVRTALAKYTLRAYACEDPEPASVVERLNNAIAKESDLEGFITLFYGLLNLRERTLCFVNAGHEPPLCLACSDCTVTELMDSGTALGVIPDMPYTQHTIHINSGDRLLFYTDGVTDARNSKGFLNLEGLKTVFLSEGLRPPKDFTERLMQYLDEWSEGHLKDDVAVMLVCAE